MKTLKSLESRQVRPTVAAALVAALALALGACSAANESQAKANTGSGSTHSGTPLSGDLNGAGSTAQQAAMESWIAHFQSAHSGVTVNYDAVGSGGGVDQFLSGAVAFAGSDAALTSDQLTQAKKVCGPQGAVEVPVYVSPIAVVYNVPGVTHLQLSPATVAEIFAGRITKWNDKAIAADNPGANLPSLAITPVHRSDSSGTTFNFTDYLSQAAPSDWTHAASEDWPFKSGEAGDGTSGVVAAVKGGDGTIGYADASQADGLATALVKVGSSYVGPSAHAASAVLDESSREPGRSQHDVVMKVNRTTTSAGVYPIILVSYQITCSTYSSPSDVKLVKAFENYVISPAGQQAAASAAGSAPIPAGLRTQAQAALNSIKAS